MNYYIFDTEASASTAQEADYSDYINSLPSGQDNTVYIAGTTSWDSPPKQRETDNKWVYQVCPASTAEGRAIEALDTGGVWFTVSEE